MLGKAALAAGLVVIVLGGGATTAVVGGGSVLASSKETSLVSTTTPVSTAASLTDQYAAYVADGRALALSNVRIGTDSHGGAGVLAMQGGSVTLDDVNVVTSGADSIPLAIGSGGGTITADDASIVSSGPSSPCLYSTGVIEVTGGVCEALRSEAAIVEGAGSVAITGASVSSKSNECAVKIFRSSAEGFETNAGSFTMSGGSFVYADKPGSLFRVTNCSAVISLSEVDLVSLSGTLLTVVAGDRGITGSNGGKATLVADGQILTGNVVADVASTVDLNLENGSLLTGAINPDDTAAGVSLTLDATSTWRVTADSYVTTIALAGGISGDTITNITGASHTVYYDASNPANDALGGNTYRLYGGGWLKPAS